MSPSQNTNLYRYEKPLRDLFVLPFWLFILTSVATFSLFGLYRTTQIQIENATVINQVIAQTASAQNASLTASQVATVLKQQPIIDNIVFYPISSTELIPNQNVTWRTYFFQNYIGISQPVYLAKDEQNSANKNQIIGYLYLSLDLSEIRHAWMLRYLALLGLIILFSFLLIATCFKRVKPFFARLSHLEHLSEQIINNKSDEIQIAINPDEKRWVFSLALEQLIGKQQHLINQIKQLLKKNRTLTETQENFAHQNSHFQNVITHELKLSLNQVNAGLKLLNGQYASNEQKDAIGIIEMGSDKLDDKLNQIIYMSRVEKGQIGVSIEKFDPIELLSNIVNNLQPIAKEKGLILSHNSHFTSYIMEGDTQKITLILTSLIENALKFTDKGTITLSSQLHHLPKDLQWQVVVSDTGIGVAKQHYEDIFQPFFQVNPNHGKVFKQTGVGLYLVKKLLDLIAGDIQLTSELSQGSTFTVTFPLTDWQKSIQYASLKDKKIAIFDPTDSYKNMVETLQATGASLKSYSDESLLLNEIIAENYHTLIFMPNVTSRMVSDITQQIRQNQTHARMLIIDTHLPADNEQEAILLADGVDYIHELNVGSDDNEVNEQALIKNLVMYLS